MAVILQIIGNIFMTILITVLPIYSDVRYSRRPFFVLCAAVASILGTILTVIQDNTMTTLLMLLFPFLVIVLFSSHKISAAILSLLNYGICVVLNYILLNIFYFLFHISEAELVQTISYMLPFFIICILYIIPIGLLSQKLLLWWIAQNIQASPKIWLLAGLFLSICVILFVFNFTYERSQGYPQDIVLVNSIFFGCLIFFTILFASIFIYLLKENSDLKAQNLYYDSFQKYTKQLEEQYLNIRGFKHNYINLLLTMDLYIKNRDLDSLDTYFQQHVLPTKQLLESSEQFLGDMQNIMDSSIKSICYNKLVRASESNLRTHLEVKRPISFNEPDIVDLSQVIGIYLDNAIEHLLTLPDSMSRILEITMFQTQTKQSIIIQNTCPEFTLDILKLGKPGYSTKGDYHGMGLYLAAKMLNTHPNITHTTQYKDNRFIQIIQIRKDEI